MRFGVFSDDDAGPITASAIVSGLASIDIIVDLIEDVAAGPPRRVDEGSCPQAAPMTRDVRGWASRRAERAYDRDAVFALPLEMLAERRVRSTLDVVLTVGRDSGASARALRAARYDIGCPAGTISDPRQPYDAPPWFLPWCGQDELRTKATLSASGPLRLPFATRTVPFTMPRLDRLGRLDLASGDPSPEGLRVAIMLASLAVAIAADPHAPRIEAATLGELMAARDLSRDRLISDRLLALCSAFERPDAIARCPRGATASAGEGLRPIHRRGRASLRGADDRPAGRLAAFT